MLDIRWRLPALISTLDDQSLLARPLLTPGVSCYALDHKRLKELLSRRVADALKQISPGNLYRHLLDNMPEVRTLTLETRPLADDLLRRHPIELPLQYVVWRHGPDALIAFIPALGIEILAEDERQLAELLKPQIKLALSRDRRTKSLRDLAALGRFRELQVRRLRLTINLPTLKEAAFALQSSAEKPKSPLKEVASKLPAQATRPLYERDADVTRLAELLTRRNPHSVLLVGHSGVGKTALVHQLARQAGQVGLGQTPFWSTSGSRIVAGMTGFGMWQERCEQIVHEASKTKTLLHLGNLIELIEVGKGGGALQGVAAMLRPHLDRGAFLAIVECTPEQLAVVEREDPRLLETFTQFELTPSSPEQTRAILRAVAQDFWSGSRVPPESLAALGRLHDRWAKYSAAPGRQLRFLRNLLEDRSRVGPAHLRSDDQQTATFDQEITPAEVTAAFSRETGLPLFMLDDALPLDLAITQAWFAERVIGQTAAVRQVVELLAAVKTDLARGGKPIASLLFIGPTGVGKTEMAKSLAEFLYQDRGRLIRFDMSEYAHPTAIERLIGGTYSAQGLLTQKVRDRPFTVVLLDEFEKAHPRFFDILLQVLGEGRLTDGLGRVTDFTNSVVIMTSNLGAESYRRRALGFAGEHAAADFAEHHFEREVKAFLRPEMFNRLDRIVPFAPLDHATIASIARRELDQVLSREGVKFRDLQVTLDDGAVAHLAAIGFDPRYGARPLKRAIERQLVAPLAEGLNRCPCDVRLTCRAELVDDSLKISVKTRPGVWIDPAASATEAIKLVVKLRRHVQALQQCGPVTRLRNEIERIHQEQHARERRLKKRGLSVPYQFTPAQALLLGQEELLGCVGNLAREVIALEDDSLNRFYASQALDAAAIQQHWAGLDRTFRDLLFKLSVTEERQSGWLTVAVFGESQSAIVELMRGYEGICKGQGEDPRWYWLKMHPSAGQPIARLLSRKTSGGEAPRAVIDIFNAAPDPFDEIPDGCIGIAMQLAGERSIALLQTESGRHEFLRPGSAPEVCMVETTMDRLLKYEPPRDIGRRGSLANLPLRRTYDFREEECRDELLKRTLPIRSRQIDEALNSAVEEYLTVRLWELIEAWS